MAGPGLPIFQPADNRSLSSGQEREGDLALSLARIDSGWLAEGVSRVSGERNLHFRLIAGTCPPGNRQIIAIRIDGPVRCQDRH